MTVHMAVARAAHLGSELHLREKALQLRTIEHLRARRMVGNWPSMRASFRGSLFPLRLTHAKVNAAFGSVIRCRCRYPSSIRVRTLPKAPRIRASGVHTRAGRSPCPAPRRGQSWPSPARKSPSVPSSTSTRRPLRAKPYAIAVPTTPAPTTIRSKDSVSCVYSVLLTKVI